MGCGEMGVDAVVQGGTNSLASQARFVANADQEPGWFKDLNIWKMRQDLGGHKTKYGLLIDDTKNIMEYENWSPISADHHYLNPIGRQYEAEQDEKEIVNQATGQASLFDIPPLSFRTWVRNYQTFKDSRKSIDESVLRSQF